MEIVKTSDGYFVKVDDTEAAELIKSLAAQLASKNPNVGRLESFTKKGEYFSIGVAYAEGFVG